MSERRLGRRAVAAWLVAAAIGSCNRGGSDKTDDPLFKETHPSKLKVLVIGIDGATFDVMEPLLAENRLPAFRQLMDRGTHAKLRSQQPILSPAIWTTIATGHPRQDHGINDFVADAGADRKSPKLVSSADRKTLAIWNILGPFQKSVGVIGWWVSWPAEPVRGFLVSDRVAHSRWQSWTEGDAGKYLTSPPKLFDEIKADVVDPAHPPLDEIEPLVSLTESEKTEFLAAKKPILFHGMSVFKFGYCEQRTYERIASRLLSREQPDLSMVFLIAVDPISHTFWHYYQPGAFGGGVNKADAERLGKLVPNMYVHDDRYLAELLSHVDVGTTVIVVSDHGFQPSGQLPHQTSEIDYQTVGIDRREKLDRPINVGMTGWHHINGVFIAAGGPIVRGAVCTTQPSVLDITPTVLALMGLPIARDMPGRVLTELIDPAYLAEHPIRTIESYEDHIDREVLRRATEEKDDTARTDYLESLGYIQKSK